ncbi:MAG: amidohydrolase [Hyphomicrobiaceae bacterium]
MAQAADLVVLNGRVLTMDANTPRAEAVAVRGNRIFAVGTSRQVSELRDRKTRVIDAQGASVLPGFIEAHLHIFPGGASLDALSLMDIYGLERLTQVTRAFAAKRPDDKIILARHASYTMMGPHEPTTRHHLDKALPDRPFAMVSSDGHTMWANTKALEAGNLLRGGMTPPGSQIVMGEDGFATGELREPGAYKVLNTLTPTGGREVLGLRTGDDPDPPATKSERELDKRTLRKGLDYCASLGITSLHNMDGNVYQLELLEEIDREGHLTVRSEIPFHFMNHMPLARLEVATEMHARWHSERLHSGRVKLFMDGVIESSTAFMLDDYCGKPGVRGLPWFEAEPFNEIATEIDRRGLQISVHAIGDGAVRRTLDGYEAARRANGPRDSRHRIEHIEALDAADVPRFKQLGVVASMQPLHPPGKLSFPLEPTVSLLGPKRLPLAYAWRTLRDAGAHLSFASDWPVSPVDPLLSITAAMTREKLSPECPDHRQTLMESLSGYTVDNAWTEFREHVKGRLVPGLLADIVVLDGDIEATAPEAIRDLKVKATVMDGSITYEA